MLIIPIRTDYRRRRIPWVNYALVAANILIFILGYNGHGGNYAKIDRFMLNPGEPTLLQFFSCMFLHAGIWHLLGNMVFLWVFGNAMNDKLGHVGYLAFYLAAGVFAGIGYLLLAGHAPVLGASGAIAGVTGAYLVLLPATNVTVVFFLFYYPIPFVVSSLWFIVLQSASDFFMTAYGLTGPAKGGVAHAAHASGYAFGALIAVLLLVLRLLKRDDYDMMHMLKAYHRKTKYQRLINQGYDPFSTVGTMGRRIENRSRTTAPAKTVPAAEMDLRRRIAEAVRGHNLPMATQLYRDLLAISPQALLPVPQQLDIANHLMASQEHTEAAAAYELFVRNYDKYEYIGDIYLMLGVLHGRYLGKYREALDELNEALKRLTVPSKRQFAQQVADEVKAKLGQ